MFLCFAWEAPSSTPSLQYHTKVRTAKQNLSLSNACPWKSFKLILSREGDHWQQVKRYKGPSFFLFFFFPTIRQAAYLSTNYECTWRIPLEILSWGPSIFLLGAQHHQKQLDDYGHSGLCSMTTFCRNPKCYSTQIRYDQGPLLVPKEQHDKMSFELTLFLSIYT